MGRRRSASGGDVEAVLEEGFEVGGLASRRELEIEDPVARDRVARAFGLDEQKLTSGRVDRQGVGAVARPAEPGQAKTGRGLVDDGELVGIDGRAVAGRA